MAESSAGQLQRPLGPAYNVRIELSRHRDLGHRRRGSLWLEQSVAARPSGAVVASVLRRSADVSVGVYPTSGPVAVPTARVLEFAMRSITP